MDSPERKPLTVEELQAKIARVQRLLDDPQPGLMTWNTFLKAAMDDLVKAWTES